MEPVEVGEGPWSQGPSPNRAARIGMDYARAPDLQIVPPQLWADAHARIRREPRGRGTKPGVGKGHGSIFSGLMTCGVCGGAFNIVGRREKAGKLYVSLGCSVFRSRGESICANRRTLDEGSSMLTFGPS